MPATHTRPTVWKQSFLHPWMVCCYATAVLWHHTTVCGCHMSYFLATAALWHHTTVCDCHMTYFICNALQWCHWHLDDATVLLICYWAVLCYLNVTQHDNTVACIPVARQCPQHAVSSMGTVFASSADGLSLCNSCTVMSHSSMWLSHDIFPMWCAVMMSLILGWNNSTVDRDISTLSDSKLHDEGQTGRRVVVELVAEASKVEPGLQKNTGGLSVGM
jgi:hypothetical protein